LEFRHRTVLEIIANNNIADFGLQTTEMYLKVNII